MTFSLYSCVKVSVLAASLYRVALKIDALTKNWARSGILHAPSPFNFSPRFDFFTRVLSHQTALTFGCLVEGVIFKSAYPKVASILRGRG
jgi:hypothetical protein